jgi:hypothetical protein
MRFVIVDLEGASRDYFSEWQDLVEALTELEAEAPGTTEEVFVMTYDEANERCGEPERGDEVLAQQQSAAKTYRHDSTRTVVWARSAAHVTTRPESARVAGRSREAVPA